MNLHPKELLNRLEPAGAFLTEEEVVYVVEAEGESDGMGRIIEVLRGKGNIEFDSFLKVLRDSGNEVWADRIEESSDQFIKVQSKKGV